MAQNTELETLNEEWVSLYKQGKYDRAIIIATRALGVAECSVSARVGQTGGRS
jgi:hypothetical protein